MPNVTINIPQPILVAGQHFKTRYRTLPSVAWSSYVNRTNASFTLTGLSAGQYQLEVILVKADSTECNPVYKSFDVVVDFTCISFAASIVQNGALYYAQITYTLPPGFVNPACGWNIELTQGSTPTVSIPYATLPPGGVIKIPVQNVGGVVRIKANLCGGTIKMCSERDLTPVVPVCTSLTITDGKLFRVGTQWFITINFIQSVPATTSLKVYYYHAIGATINNADTATFMTTIASTATSVTFQVNPHYLAGMETIAYDVYLTDACNSPIYKRVTYNFF